MGANQHDASSDVDKHTTVMLERSSLNIGMSTMNEVCKPCEPVVGCESSEAAKLPKVVKDVPSIPSVYRQDVVKSNNSGMIGIVTEVSGDSDSDGSITDDEEDDDEEEDEDGENEPDESRENDEVGGGVSNGSTNKSRGADGDRINSLPADQIRVIWVDDSQTTQKLSDVRVVDRGFLHGDFVAAASDPTGQVGVVVDVNISVDLVASDGSITKGVSSRELARVSDFTVGDYVVLGPWLGRVDDVLDNVVVLFDDGSKCKVVRADPTRLKPVGKNILEDEHFPYYPGQRVKATTSSVFKNAKWEAGSWKRNRVEGTITKVTVGSVFIYWIASAGYGPDSSTAPAEEQGPKNLKLLSCFSHANWQLGDWCLLPSLPSSSITQERGLSKLELSDSMNGNLDSAQLRSDYDSEPTAEEFIGHDESIDLDTVGAMDGNNLSSESNPSEKASSCGSSLSVLKEPVHETWPVHRKKIRKVVVRRDKKARKREEKFERALMIVNTKTRVDVAWQNGMIERELESINLIPIDSPGDHEFIPEQYVVEKNSDDNDNVCEIRRVGVVRSVNAKERTACLRWLKSVTRAEDPRVFDKEEVVSVYELEGHPDYDYCYGDVVVRLSPVSVSGHTSFPGDSAEESKQEGNLNGVKQDLEKRKESDKDNASGSGAEAFMDFSDLSWAGNITGLKNGDIEVTWANGMVSTVGPQAIYVVGRDDDESIDAGSEVSDDAASWETVDDDDEAFENAEEDPGLQMATNVISEAEERKEKGENISGRNGPLSFPLAALEFVTKLAIGIFSREQKHIDPVPIEFGSVSGVQSQGLAMLPESRASSNESIPQKSNFVGNRVSQTNHRVVKSAHATEASKSDVAEEACNLKAGKPDISVCYDDDASNFKRFDTARDPLDHYFLGATGQNNNGRKWHKKVQQDWSILQNNLPDGIYVRVYEDRMDVLRAVIVGAYGTPYQDGLFFFDFHLPPEYPDVPPSAYYHSGGWRINPNLYEEGKVCLSLLNTWTGRGNEVWDPLSSSILQVLVSLQGLVLNSKPYFNEAGYNKQVGTAEGEKNSLSYNENTFLLSCKTMMYLMRKPPKDFEDLIKEHFRIRGYYILKACDAYMKGRLIGSLTKDALVSDMSDTNATSVGFKLMLAKIVPKLYSSLSEVGADCHEFKHLV